MKYFDDIKNADKWNVDMNKAPQQPPEPEADTDSQPQQVSKAPAQGPKPRPMKTAQTEAAPEKAEDPEAQCVQEVQSKLKKAGAAPVAGRQLPKPARLDLKNARPDNASSLSRNRRKRQNSKWTIIASGLCVSIISGVITYMLYFKSDTHPSSPQDITEEVQETVSQRLHFDDQPVVVADVAQDEGNDDVMEAVDADEAALYPADTNRDDHGIDTALNEKEYAEETVIEHDEAYADPEPSLLPDTADSEYAGSVTEPDNTISDEEIYSAAPEENDLAAVSLRNDLLSDTVQENSAMHPAEENVPVEALVEQPAAVQVNEPVQPPDTPALQPALEVPPALPEQEAEVTAEVHTAEEAPPVQVAREEPAVGPASGQTLQGAATAGLKEMSVDYEYPFNESGNAWPEYEREDHAASITDGYYMLKTSGSAAQTVLYPHGIPAEMDFMLEGRFASTGSDETITFGLVIGASDSSTNYSFQLHGRNLYSITRRESGQATMLKSGASDSVFISASQWNTLKIVKQQKTVQFYIDNYYIDAIENVSLDGDKFGIVSGGTGTLSVDWLKTKYRFRKQ